MLTWTLILIASTAAGVVVQPMGSIPMADKAACVTALRTLHDKSGKAMSGLCIDQKTGVVISPTFDGS